MVMSKASGMISPAKGGGGGGALPLASLNHVSVVCRSLESSLSFYRDVLGFIPVRRPGSFDFDGAWLFNYGIGIHLLQAEEPESMPPNKTEINPKDNHISFTCESMEAVQRRLKEMGIRYEQRRVEEGGVYVDQIFFHDPDTFMIEVCTCDNLPVVPLVPAGGDQYAILGLPPPPAMACKRSFKQQQHQQPILTTDVPVKANVGGGCVGEAIMDAKNAIPAATGSGGAMMSCLEQAFMQV